jgi:hypothetical protein
MSGAPPGRNARPINQRWPDAEQTLLLQAALGEAPIAQAAWAEWSQRIGIDDQEASTQRIFPLLYRNLAALEVNCPELERLKGVYRYHWVSNQLLRDDARNAFHALHEGKIETLSLNGLALAETHYLDPATRPIVEVDVLVHPHDAQRAFALLTELGYVPAPGFTGHRLRTGARDAMVLRNPAGRSLSLRWHSLPQSIGDEDLWPASVPLKIVATPARVPCAADQLLLSCVDASAGSSPDPIGFVADAVSVIRTSGHQLDWARLLERADARGCNVAVLDALVHLQPHIDIPAAVTQELRSAAVSRTERLAHWAAARSHARVPFYFLQWDRYRRQRAAGGPGASTSFAEYMAEFWDLDGRRQLAKTVFSKAVRLRPRRASALADA